MTARLTLALTAAEKDLLERAARLNGRSLSSELAVRVRRTLGEREPQGVASSSGPSHGVDEPGSRSPSDLSLAGRDQAYEKEPGYSDGAAHNQGVGDRGRAPLPASDLAGKAKPDPRVQTKRRR